MFEFHQQQANLTSVTPRTEVHGEDRVFAISLGIKIKGPNTLLDRIHPTLRHALYTVVPDQDNLPGVETSTPLLRSSRIDEVKIKDSYEGWTLSVDHGIDDKDPIKIGGCKVSKLRCVPMEGGSIELMFSIGSNDIDATEAGLLCSHLSQEILFTLTAPEKPAEAIDGTAAAFKKDHPGAPDMFSADDTGAKSPEQALAEDSKPATAKQLRDAERAARFPTAAKKAASKKVVPFKTKAALAARKGAKK